MKTEKAIQVQITNYPSGLLHAIKDIEGWENARTHYDPHPDGEASYEIQFNGKRVLSHTKWNGYGFGADAVYPYLRLSVFNLLRTVYPNHVRSWDGKPSEQVIYENDYQS